MKKKHTLDKIAFYPYKKFVYSILLLLFSLFSWYFMHILPSACLSFNPNGSVQLYIRSLFRVWVWKKLWAQMLNHVDANRRWQWYLLMRIKTICIIYEIVLLYLKVRSNYYSHIVFVVHQVFLCEHMSPIST